MAQCDKVNNGCGGKRREDSGRLSCTYSSSDKMVVGTEGNVRACEGSTGGENEQLELSLKASWSVRWKREGNESVDSSMESSSLDEICGESKENSSKEGSAGVDGHAIESVKEGCPRAVAGGAKLAKSEASSLAIIGKFEIGGSGLMTTQHEECAK
jgi:hypothetical protein